MAITKLCATADGAYDEGQGALRLDLDGTRAQPVAASLRIYGANHSRIQGGPMRKTIATATAAVAAALLVPATAQAKTVHCGHIGGYETSATKMAEDIEATNVERGFRRSECAEARMVVRIADTAHKRLIGVDDHDWRLSRRWNDPSGSGYGMTARDGHQVVRWQVAFLYQN